MKKTYDSSAIFPDMIGQDQTKSILGEWFKGYMANGRMPHFMFTAPRGCGKTFMASLLADALSGVLPPSARSCSTVLSYAICASSGTRSLFPISMTRM